jgi:four helix bundle protein
LIYYRCMKIERLEDLIAFQLAVNFKLSVYDLVRGSVGANRDRAYVTQLFSAAASVEMNIAEGWGRASTGDMIKFFSYARGSLYEARQHVRDGVSRGHFTSAECEKALKYANRCAGAVTNLGKSLEPYVKSTRPFGKPIRRKGPSIEP